MSHAVETVEGTVEQRNPTGVRIRGQWYNASKFRPLELPEVGERVRVSFDTKGFLVDVDVLDGAPTPTVVSDNGVTVRLAVLQAAASFLGQLARTRDEIKADHVLVLADRWLEWVER